MSNVNSGPGTMALLLVDLQKAFCGPEGTAARNGRDVTTCRDAALKCLDLVAAARKGGVPVVWTRMALHPDYTDGGLMISEIIPMVKERGGLREGTADTELISEAVVEPQDHVVTKQRYSAFIGTNIEVILRSLRVDTLIVGGVTTSMCVESTVRDAAQRDYRTIVVREACSDWAADRHEPALTAMEFGFARIVSQDEAVTVIETGKFA